MANAQILVLVSAPSEISTETFAAIVERAARAQGLGLGPWTYDATASTMAQAGSSFVERVVGGPWDGLEITSGTTVPASRRMVISAFRQNLAGLPDNAAGADAALSALGTIVRAELSSRGSVRLATRTTRNAISWDRGVPRPIDLSETGQTSGIGWGVVAGLTALAIFVVRGNPSGSSSSPRAKRRQKARATKRAGAWAY